MKTRRVIVLSLAVLAAGGCRQEATPSARTSTPPAGPAAAAADAATPLAEYLPPNGTPRGWTRATAIQAFGPDNLWEFIDGAAETYVSYGFQNALSTRYRGAGADVGLEVYEMADSLHAFGIFAQERPPAPSAVTAGDEGYVNGNVLVFRKGACYVKLTAATADRQSVSAMAALAAEVAKRIGAGEPLPAELAAFPRQTLVPHSVKFVPKDVLGQRSLANGFEASYQDGGATSRLVVIPFASVKEAADAFAGYRRFLADGGKVKPAPGRAGHEAFTAEDRFNGRVFAERAGRMMAISLGAQSDSAASSLVSDYLRSAAEQGKR